MKAKYSWTAIIENNLLLWVMLANNGGLAMLLERGGNQSLTDCSSKREWQKSSHEETGYESSRCWPTSMPVLSSSCVMRSSCRRFSKPKIGKHHITAHSTVTTIPSKLHPRICVHSTIKKKELAFFNDSFIFVGSFYCFYGFFFINFFNILCNLFKGTFLGIFLESFKDHTEFFLDNIIVIIVSLL